MASNIPYFFLTALVLFVAATPLAHANSDRLGNDRLIVTGQACCATNGACPGPGLAGATARLVCNDRNGNTLTIATTTLSASGTYTLTAGPNSPNPNRNARINTCVVRITVPVAGCTVLNTPGEIVTDPIVVMSRTNGHPDTITATAINNRLVPA